MKKMFILFMILFAGIGIGTGGIHGGVGMYF